MDGFFSYSDLEAGLSGCFTNRPSNSSSSSYSMNYRAIPVAKTRSFFVDDAPHDEKPRHFLDACALCRKPLRPNRDIFMYRGDVPFCSQECRQEQIEIDEEAEERRMLSAKKKSEFVAKSQASNVTDRAKSHNLRHWDGTAVAC